MFKIFMWLLLFAGFFYAYQAGWFHSITDYFSESARYSRQERVIELDDGTVTTIRYRNIVDMIMDKTK